MKVEIPVNNFDGFVVSKLSHYVTEVVDSFIDVNKCWFSVLNPKILMDDVCSLAVRKFEIPPSENEARKKFPVLVFRYLIICMAIQSPSGLE